MLSSSPRPQASIKGVAPSHPRRLFRASFDLLDSHQCVMIQAMQNKMLS